MSEQSKGTVLGIAREALYKEIDQNRNNLGFLYPASALALTNAHLNRDQLSLPFRHSLREHVRGEEIIPDEVLSSISAFALGRSHFFRWILDETSKFSLLAATASSSESSIRYLEFLRCVYNELLPQENKPTLDGQEVGEFWEFHDNIILRLTENLADNLALVVDQPTPVKAATILTFDKAFSMLELRKNRTLRINK